MRRLTVLSLVLGCLTVYAQEASSVTGRLVDDTTGEPVPFATIRLKNKMMGVISNASGDFQIPAKMTTAGDSLLISCIGYVTKAVGFRGLHEQVNIIVLRQAVTQLEQLTISAAGWRRKDKQGLSAYRIVRNALRNLSANYPESPFSYVAYYRDYQLRRGAYINLNEAIVEVHDGGFKTDDQAESKISLIQYKENIDFPRDSATAVAYDNKPATFYKDKNKYIPNAILSPLGGNELGILRLHDAIRNYNVMSYSYVNVFSKDFTENHSFKLEKPIFLDSVALYSISFESNYAASGARNFATGRILIGITDFAIHKIEYKTFNKTMREVQLMYEIQLEYARRGSSMYLNYISFNNFFKTQNEREFKVIDITFDRSASAFQLQFNSEPERTSVQDIRNYDFRIDDQPLAIKRIEIVDKVNVRIFVDETLGNTLEVTLANSPSKLKFGVRNVKDVANRELDKVVSSNLYQFRELFVQKLDLHPAGLPASGNIDRARPLGMNPISPTSDGTVGYWMNTPLKGE